VPRLKVFHLLPYPLAFLASLPLGWLLSEWGRDAGQSLPAWLAAVAAGVLLWRLVGEQMPGSSASLGYVLSLLLCGAALRRLSRPLRLRPCAAAARRLDHYALDVLAGTPRRRQPLPTPRLVLLGVLWVPAEMLLRRVLGFALQPLAA
jgi:hypothetical protein